MAVLLAATFAGASVAAIAAEQTKTQKKPSAAECKKNPNLKGCPKKK